MGTEIERKFAVADNRWRAVATRSQRLRQGYLTDPHSTARCSVRVRIGGDAAWLGIKSARAGIERSEYEYRVPLDDAERMLREFAAGTIEKVRHYVPCGGLVYEVDEFFGDNAGLVVAELELQSAAQAFERPAWLGREISAARRYYNLHLIDHPFSRWTAQERAEHAAAARPFAGE